MSRPWFKRACDSDSARAVGFGNVSLTYVRYVRGPCSLQKVRKMPDWRTHLLTCKPCTFTAKLMVMDSATITVKVATDDETERLFVAVEEALREGKKRDANLPDSEEGFELYVRDQAIQRGKQISEYRLIEKVNISAVGIGVRWREYRWQRWREFAGLPERRCPDCGKDNEWNHKQGPSSWMDSLCRVCSYRHGS